MANNVELEIRAKNLTQEAFDKVSAALKALEETSGQTTTASSGHFKEWFGTITGGVAAGEVLGHALEKVLDVGARIPGLLLDMAERGSKMNDVERAFEGLAQSAGGASAVLDKLREGTKGTVDDFDLMKVANRSLSDGMKLSANDFGVMAQGARLLAKATGSDTKEAFESLNQAMATGRTRALNLIGVHIDADEALQRYSRTIGKSVSDFTDQDRVAATAADVMRLLRQRTQEAGDQELSFGEKVGAAKTRLQNIYDETAKQIAQSPALSGAMDVVNKAMDAAFGEDNQKAIKAIVTLIIDTGIAGAKAASFIAEGAKDIVVAYEHARGAFDSFMQSVNQGAIAEKEAALAAMEKVAATSTSATSASKLRVQELRIELAKLKGEAAGYDADYNAAMQTAESAKNAEKEAQKFLSEFIQQLEKTGTAGKKAGDDIKTGLGGDDGFKMASKDVLALLEEAKKLSAEFTNLASHVGQQGAIDKLGPKFDEVRQKAMELGVSYKALGAQFDANDEKVRNSEFLKLSATLAASVKPGVESVIGDLKKLGDASEQGLTSEATLVNGALSAHQRLTEQTLYGTAQRLAAINDAEKKELEAFTGDRSKMSDLERANYDQRLGDTKAFYQHQRDLANGTADTIEERMRALGINTQADLDKNAADAKRDYLQMLASGEYSAAQLQAAWKRMTDANIAAGHGWLFSFEQDLNKIGVSILDAFASGGNIGQAAKSGAQLLGSDISSKLLSGTVNKLAADGHGMLSEALGEFAGPLGGAAVSLGLQVGSELWNAMFGTAGRDAIKSFVNSQFGGDFNALQQRLATMGPAGQDYWKLLTQQTGRKNADQAKTNIDTVTKALADQQRQFDSDLQSILGNAQGMGYVLPESIQRSIAALDHLGLVSEQDKTLLANFTGDGQVSAQKMEEAAGRLGISLDALGPAFRNAKMHDTAQQMLDDLDLLERGGANLNDLLGDKGLQEKLSGLAQQSLKFGTEIPGNFRPLLDQLAKSGQLLDENGNKITDISKLTFGDDLKVGLQAVVDKLQQILDKLGQVPGAMNAIPRNVDVDVNYNQHYNGPDGRVGLSPDDGGASGDNGLPSYDVGGYIDRDQTANIHQGELIGPVEFMTNALTGALAAIGGIGGGNDFAVAPVILDGQKLADLLVRRIPNSVQSFGVRQ